MTQNTEQRVAVIIEDDADIRELLGAVLTQAGFDVVATANGPEGIAAVEKHNPIVTTLDVNMPGMDGFEVAKRIRAFSCTYLVMLTAQNDEIDALMGLESGADDYVSKPFRPRELRARIEAMLRRPRMGVPTPHGGQSAVPTPQPVMPPSGAPSVLNVPDVSVPVDAPLTAATPRESAAVELHSSPDLQTGMPENLWLTHNGLRLNPDTRIVLLEGAEVELTRTEFDLLTLLLESGRRVRSKADLALALRGESYVTSQFISESDRRAVEVHMANLRRKISDNSATPRFIETVRGIGYRLTASV